VTSENLKTASPFSASFEQLWREEYFYSASRAERWDVTRETFAETLCRSAEKRFGESVPELSEARSYLQALYLEDLALACGCRQGNPQAWEYFFQTYRETLYAAARAVVGRASMNEARARDLADSLYGELYGGNLRSGDSASERRSLFAYFHGRSKLATWLRAVLAQRHVNAFRAARHTESLEESNEGAAANPGKDSYAVARLSVARFVSPDPDGQRAVPVMQEALVAALSSLPSRDRLRLALYYLRDMTLAQIGRLLSEHEATTSRQLERIRKDIRCTVEELLRAKHLSAAEIHMCFSAAQDEWPFDLSTALEADASQPPVIDRQAATGGESGNHAAGSSIGEES
jgi:RNA polymerase sigma factor (sigma-70 family)